MAPREMTATLPAVRISRRSFVAGSAAGLLIMSLPRIAVARPSLDEALLGFSGGKPINDGRVKLDIPPLLENGNAVSITVDVESPMTISDHVRRIAIFNEHNPQADVIVFNLGPRTGRARVATRIRLATSQTVVAIAELTDGTFWSSRASVIVTLAACIEE
jgi:sulfur-oxidizing protein SoxY